MIAASRHLRFGGLQAYHGAAQHKRTPEERRAGIADAINAVAALVDDLKKAGLDCAIVGGAGTGTFELEAEAEFIPSCRSARTFSWTRTIGAISRRRRFAKLCSC